MPVQTTYPGVYIEEISSGVRTITGVATSIAAFIGRALRGPVDTPVTINSFADFERTFGGLWADSSLGFTVQDFFQNGGGQAIVVRLFPEENGEGAKASTRKLTVDTLKLKSAYPGKWGANLRTSVDHAVAKEVAEAMGLTKEDLFNLTVRDTAPGGITEKFLNVSIKDSARRVDKVLAGESKLVVWDDENGTTTFNTALVRPLEGSDAETAAPAAAEAALKAAQEAEPPKPEDIKKAEEALKKAKEAADASNGKPLTQADFLPDKGKLNKEGLYALDRADLFNLLCLPHDLTDDVAALVSAAAKYCEDRRAMLLVDPPADWNDVEDALKGVDKIGTRSKNAALFFPRLRRPHPLRGGIEDFVPCGAVAGVMARTDAQRGVWKAPAGLDATLAGVPELSVPLTDAENGQLNPRGINCLRVRPAAGRVVWGARTLQGDDMLASEWKYIPVRRLALFLEESLYRGTQWVVFEPNDEPLWAQIRMNVGAFMQNLFRQGAFQGKSPREAYLVKCDKETTTQNHVNLGIVNIVVGFAPLKPAEFVIIKIQQLAGQIET